MLRESEGRRHTCKKLGEIAEPLISKTRKTDTLVLFGVALSVWTWLGNPKVASSSPPRTTVLTGSFWMQVSPPGHY